MAFAEDEDDSSMLDDPVQTLARREREKRSLPKLVAVHSISYKHTTPGSVVFFLLGECVIGKIDKLTSSSLSFSPSPFATRFLRRKLWSAELQLWRWSLWASWWSFIDSDHFDYDDNNFGVEFLEIFSPNLRRDTLAAATSIFIFSNHNKKSFKASLNSWIRLKQLKKSTKILAYRWLARLTKIKQEHQLILTKYLQIFVSSISDTKYHTIPARNSWQEYFVKSVIELLPVIAWIYFCGHLRRVPVFYTQSQCALVKVWDFDSI